ncbi:MAG: hypothetical protein LBQ35_07110 [Spirochaetaceae bacterium]|jgi:hypothetical protein|nr:hypothetical protein [Spirochaetaceae bacterium]
MDGKKAGSLRFSWRRGNATGKTREEHRKILRRVFLSPDGLEVLRLLLNDWSFFDVCETEQQRVLNEYAKVFLYEKLGMAGIEVYTDVIPELHNEE